MTGRSTRQNGPCAPLTARRSGRGSFGYTTTLSGTYTGGYFNYTDADKDIDIECSVGGGSHTKSVNRRATSVYDASVQLCAELNSANHGTVKLRFGVDGDWRVSAGNCIALTGFGNLNGKYFVDKVTHKVSSNGLTTDFECSGIGPDVPFVGRGRQDRVSRKRRQTAA